MIIWLHWALIWVSKTASGGVKIASKVEGKISVHHCLLLHAQQHNVISYFMLHFKASHYLTFSSYQNKSCYFNFLRRTLACPWGRPTQRLKFARCSKILSRCGNYVRTGDVTWLTNSVCHCALSKQTCRLCGSALSLSYYNWKSKLFLLFVFRRW